MDDRITQWLARQQWQLFPFQQEVANQYDQGHSGLLNSVTGSGKTYAIWFACLNSYLQSGRRLEPAPAGLCLWVTPMRALALDTQKSLQRACDGCGIPWQVGLRTGDTPNSQKQKQNKHLPPVLVITPESLSLLLSLKSARELFKHTEAIIVDEWHELLGNKRGVQTQLACAYIRGRRPNCRIWGLSATLGNLDEAARTLCATTQPVIVKGMQERPTKMTVITPKVIESFPWAGHLGLRHVQALIPSLETKSSTLVFTNTRAQAERWYQALLEARPEWAGVMALHHSTLDNKTRKWVEQECRSGNLKVVVCTSSLDLGVDFSPVEQVVQIGSPKGVARCLQRAGRSQHHPGGMSEIILMPTHAFEIVEYEALREAVNARKIEPRRPLDKPYDVLIQHCVTLAIGEGFDFQALFNEVKTAPAYADLTKTEWQAICDFITRGGHALQAYPEYHKVVEHGGRYTVTSKRIAMRHRMNIGTITSDAMISVQFQRGKKIADVEESFVSKLKPGDIFYLDGKSLEFIRLHDMKAQVKLSKKKAKIIPRWAGGVMPLSSELSAALQNLLSDIANNKKNIPAVKPLFDIQASISHVPCHNECLVEVIHMQGGCHCFIFPFAGRVVHEMMASVFAYRLCAIEDNTFSIAVNDYGFHLSADKPFHIDAQRLKRLVSTSNLTRDCLACVDEAQLAKRQFRDIARIAGLVFSGYPGAQKTTRMIQASSSLIYDVLKQYDENNILLQQAELEVLQQSQVLGELQDCFERCRQQNFVVIDLMRLTPFSFPLWVESQRLKVSNETLEARIERMIKKLHGFDPRE